METLHALGPDDIQARSFEIIAELLPDYDQAAPEWPIVRRIVHATGDPSIARLLRIHSRAVESGLTALTAGCPIITDVRMVSSGINRSLAGRLGCEVLCAVDDPTVAEIATKQKITRSAAAIINLSSRIPGAIVAIGNAPTALFALLRLLEGGSGAPALVVGTPVGFVGAAESKADLVRAASPTLPFITVEGTRGGSSIADAAVNALLQLAAQNREPSRAREAR